MEKLGYPLKKNIVSVVKVLTKKGVLVVKKLSVNSNKNNLHDLMMFSNYFKYQECTGCRVISEEPAKLFSNCGKEKLH